MGEEVSRAGSAWAKIVGSWGSSGSDGDTARLERSSAGLMFGADRALSDTWRLGVVGGHARTQEKVADRSSSATAQNLSFGGYVGGKFERLTLSAGLSQTWTSLDMSRTVAFPGFAGHLTGGPGLDVTQLFGEAAYGLNLPRQQAQLFGDVALVNVHSQSGNEDGGAAALTVHGKDQGVGFVTLGLKDSVKLSAQGLAADASVAWRHAEGDVRPSSTQSFSGGSDFTVQGAPIGRDAVVLKGTLGGEIAPRLTVQLGYSGQFSRGAQDQDVKLAVSLRF
jgi:outer membrane autotransporter protein